MQLPVAAERLRGVRGLVESVDAAAAVSRLEDAISGCSGLPENKPSVKGGPV